MQKITELRNEKKIVYREKSIFKINYMQIQLKKKDNYIEQRRQLYVENTKIHVQEKEDTVKTTHVQDLARIHKIAKQYERVVKLCKKVSQTIEKYINKIFENTKENEKNEVDKEEEAEA